MENTNLTTKQLLERWKLLIEHKNDGLPKKPAAENIDVKDEKIVGIF